MSAPPTVSVVVPSRDRPEALARCLRALSQLVHPGFEVVVVADPAGCRVAAEWDRAVRVPFDEPNLAAARNLGVAASAGEIVAFVDDDAVPEPTWLARLVAPFADPAVAAAGGLVRGRNGLSVQWGASEIDGLGQRLPLYLPGDRLSLRTGRPGLGLKTEGTNMAVRRSVLARLGGFDPAFRFYLEEADMNLRLAAEGAVVAWVPGAEVHHGFLASPRRRADRVPRDLHDVGASLAAFHLRHAPGAVGQLAAETDRQRRRLVAHMLAGRIEPGAVRPLLATLAAGWAEGLTRLPRPLPPLPPPQPRLRPFRAAPPGRARLLAGRRRARRAILAEARALAVQGDRPQVFLFSPTPLRHRVSYDAAGYWLQEGGLWGPALRSEPRCNPWRFVARLAKEVARVRDIRSIEDAASSGRPIRRPQPLIRDIPPSVCHQDQLRIGAAQLVGET